VLDAIDRDCNSWLQLVMEETCSCWEELAKVCLVTPSSPSTSQWLQICGKPSRAKAGPGTAISTEDDEQKAGCFGTVSAKPRKQKQHDSLGGGENIHVAHEISRMMEHIHQRLTQQSQVFVFNFCTNNKQF
jgi:hypothetical protein